VQCSGKLRDNSEIKIIMDRNRNRKRKATDGASPKAEGSASKRQKTRLVSAHDGIVCCSGGQSGSGRSCGRFCSSAQSTVMLMLRAR